MMISAPVTPELLVKDLSREDLGEHGQALDEVAEQLEVRIKMATNARADTTINPTAAEAFTALADGAVNGVQVCYVLEGVGYCDTFMARPDGQARLVRRVIPVRDKSGR